MATGRASSCSEEGGRKARWWEQRYRRGHEEDLRGKVEGWGLSGYEERGKESSEPDGQSNTCDGGPAGSRRFVGNRDRGPVRVEHRSRATERATPTDRARSTLNKMESHHGEH